MVCSNQATGGCVTALVAGRHGVGGVGVGLRGADFLTLPTLPCASMSDSATGHCLLSMDMADRTDQLSMPSPPNSLAAFMAFLTTCGPGTGHRMFECRGAGVWVSPETRSALATMRKVRPMCCKQAKRSAHCADAVTPRPTTHLVQEACLSDVAQGGRAALRNDQLVGGQRLLGQLQGGGEMRTHGVNHLLH